MLRLARLRADLLGPASLNPRNEGPLMDGDVCETAVVERRSSGAVVGAAAPSVAKGAGATTDTGCGGAEVATGVDSSDAPHIPQKRFWSRFSLPQRGQRTESLLIYSLRYLTGSMQREDGAVRGSGLTRTQFRYNHFLDRRGRGDTSLRTLRNAGPSPL